MPYKPYKPDSNDTPLQSLYYNLLWDDAETLDVMADIQISGHEIPSHLLSEHKDLRDQIKLLEALQ